MKNKKTPRVHRKGWRGAHHGDEAPDEAEVGEVVGVDGGGRVYLQAVVVLAGVLEQTVHGVEDLVRQQEEPLPVGREDRDVTYGGESGTDTPQTSQFQAARVRKEKKKTHQTHTYLNKDID